jgi:hypothetical protein
MELNLEEKAAVWIAPLAVHTFIIRAIPTGLAGDQLIATPV